ncbi:hypothetical protein AGDE_16795 [Angomonas deanei]|uniref:Uncharacterized protein n=1 Tax=Angomonas deanei TaxID=59799 RepID=A0A7G2CCJ0_9TRYP|nr:hypothetical protein AGDE_16795 [Angomonas deanei]CAD2215802.1 hypothetical protein, conserved [Angomonas deanei]|eukprot:EPY16178.1 hypothetical protein AGDE_16795 [Angomonas deanei]
MIRGGRGFELSNLMFGSGVACTSFVSSTALLAVGCSASFNLRSGRGVREMEGIGVGESALGDPCTTTTRDVCRSSVLSLFPALPNRVMVERTRPFRSTMLYVLVLLPSASPECGEYASTSIFSRLSFPFTLSRSSDTRAALATSPNKPSSGCTCGEGEWAKTSIFNLRFRLSRISVHPTCGELNPALASPEILRDRRDSTGIFRILLTTAFTSSGTTSSWYRLKGSSSPSNCSATERRWTTSAWGASMPA